MIPQRPGGGVQLAGWGKMLDGPHLQTQKAESQSSWAGILSANLMGRLGAGYEKSPRS